MTLFLLSLTGHPADWPGSSPRSYVILAAVQAGGWLTILAVIAVLNAAAAAFYYLRVVVYMFMRELDDRGEPSAPRLARLDRPVGDDRAHDRPRPLPGPAPRDRHGRGQGDPVGGVTGRRGRVVLGRRPRAWILNRSPGPAPTCGLQPVRRTKHGENPPADAHLDIK